MTPNTTQPPPPSSNVVGVPDFAAAAGLLVDVAMPPAPPKTPLVYVAGPYRDPRGGYYVERNIRAAEAVALKLWRLGCAVICPHANTRHFDGYAGLPAETWLRGDLVMVERCDAVVVLPGWEWSEGTQGEIAHATLRGVPVHHWPCRETLAGAFGLAAPTRCRWSTRTIPPEGTPCTP